MKIISKNGKKVLVISKKEWKQVDRQYRFAMDLPDPEQIKAVIDIVEKLNQELNGLSQATSAYKFVPEKKKTLEINKNLRDFLGLAERMRKASSEGKMNKIASMESQGMSDEEMIEKFKQFADHGEANKKGIKEEDVDAKELEMGIEVEYEHTIDKESSKRIALDHLAELKDYYTRLKKMEEEGKKEGAGVE